MKVNREKLQEALTIVKPGLADKEILEQHTSFAFVDNSVVTNNGEISISHPIEGIDFEGAVKAEELYGLLSKLKKSEVNFEVNGSELKLSCGRVKAGLKLEKEINNPPAEVEKWHKLKKPDQFVSHLKFAMQTCSKDLSQPKLTLISVSKNGVIQASDGFRILKCKGAKMPVNSFLISSRVAPRIVEINPTKIALDKSYIYFQNDEGTVLSCRLSNEKEYLPQESIEAKLNCEGGEEFEFPSKVTDMLERVRQFAKRDFILDETVQVVVESNKIKMRAETEDTKSWVEETAKVKFDKSISFYITPLLFKDILEETQNCELNEGISKVKFTTDNWEYVICLIGKGE